MAITTFQAILLFLLLLILVGAIPAWPYSAAWGLAPSVVAGVILLILAALFFAGWP